MSTPTERRYRREARYSKQLRVTVQPATAAALEAEADAAGTVKMDLAKHDIGPGRVVNLVFLAAGATVPVPRRRPQKTNPAPPLNPPSPIASG